MASKYRVNVEQSFFITINQGWKFMKILAGPARIIKSELLTTPDPNWANLILITGLHINECRIGLMQYILQRITYAHSTLIET